MGFREWGVLRNQGRLAEMVDAAVPESCAQKFISAIKEGAYQSVLVGKATSRLAAANGLRPAFVLATSFMKQARYRSAGPDGYRGVDADLEGGSDWPLGGHCCHAFILGQSSSAKDTVINIEKMWNNA